MNTQIPRIALVLFTVTTLSCASTGINQGDFSLMSVEEEWELGAQLAADVAKEVPLLDTSAIQGYVTRLGNTLVAQATGDTPVADQPWTFHVVDHDDINAFNIPGGHVYVHSGLVAAAGNYAELAAVMAHEVSHGLARHAAENISKQYGLSILAGVVLGENPAVYEEILAGVLAGGAIMKFSRDAEREADRLGVAYMYEAGIDPVGMEDFLTKLLVLRQQRPSDLDQFFSSHPLAEERIQAVRKQRTELPAKSLVRTESGFAAFQRAVASAAGATTAGKL